MIILSNGDCSTIAKTMSLGGKTNLVMLSEKTTKNKKRQDTELVVLQSKNVILV
jgi:hypothetical protein